MSHTAPAPAPIPTLRPSACPGLWRIVQALDGGICRIKLDGGRLTAAQALAVADAAERYAGGVIEATNRSNLQIRGITGEHPALVGQLLAAGLGPREAAGDDVRNLMLSPSAGLDRGQLFDSGPLAAQILQSLQATPRFHQLSAKFAVQLDAGEDLAMLDHPHDLWLSAFELEGGVWLALGLAGCPGQDAPLGAVPLAQGHALVVAVLERFLDLASPEQSRMRQLLAGMDVEAFLDGLPVALRRDFPWTGRQRAAAPYPGVYPQRQPGKVAVGASAPLGRLTAQQLRGAAEVATRLGDASLRLTPWQGLLLPNIDAAHAAAALAQLSALGLLCDPAEPLAQMVACTGSAGCAKALADTKADAVRLASMVQGGGVASIHLSGCPRSCALAHTAPATLMAVGPGRYDLLIHDRGPEQRNLTLEEAGAALNARLRSNLDD